MTKKIVSIIAALAMVLSLSVASFGAAKAIPEPIINGGLEITFESNKTYLTAKDNTTFHSGFNSNIESVLHNGTNLDYLQNPGFSTSGLFEKRVSLTGVIIKPGDQIVIKMKNGKTIDFAYHEQVDLMSVTTDGSTGVESTYLKFTLSKEIPGLNLTDIQIPGASEGDFILRNMSNNGPEYTIEVAGISADKTFDFQIVKYGYFVNQILPFTLFTSASNIQPEEPAPILPTEPAEPTKSEPTPADPTKDQPSLLYAILSWTGKDFVKNQTESMVVRCDGPFNAYSSVEIDGVVLDSSLVKVSEGSTIVDINVAYLNKLAVGQHKLTVNFSDGGKAEGTFTVSDKGAVTKKSPKTGDSSAAMIALGLVVLSGVAVAVNSKKVKN